jgi:hypothetical protein
MQFVELASVSEHFHPDEHFGLFFKLRDAVKVIVPHLLYSNPGDIIHQSQVLLSRQEVPSRRDPFSVGPSKEGNHDVRFRFLVYYPLLAASRDVAATCPISFAPHGQETGRRW